MTESDIKREICTALKQAGAFPVVIWQGPLSVKGISDLLVCHRGKFIAIEVKRPGGKVSNEQARFLEKVEDAGGVGFVATSAEEVIRRLGLGLPLFSIERGLNVTNGMKKAG